VNSEKFLAKASVLKKRLATALILLLLVTLTAAAEDIPRQGCRRGTPRPATALRRAQYPPLHCGGDFYKGTRHQLVVLASFKDRQFRGDEAATIEQWEKIFNTKNLSEKPFYGSIRDYFYDQSYGQFDVIFDLQYVQVDSCKKYRSTEEDDENSQYLVDDALDVLLTRDIDWSLYDWNDDGYINQVIFVFAGKGTSYGSYGGGYDTIWPHQWRLSEHFDLTTADPEDYRDARPFESNGKTYVVDIYCAVQEIGVNGGYDSFGTICHEYTHTFGFPDFYDGSTKYVGYWDLMDSGNMNDNGYCPAGYSAHERWLMGWLTPIELTKPTTVSGLPALSEEGKAYLIRNDDYSDEYYIIENRQFYGFDAKLPGAGVVVFHIDYDESIWTTFGYGMKANTIQVQHYAIIPANNRYFSSATGWAYPYNSNNRLTDTSEPAAKLWHARSDGSMLMSKPLFNIAIDSTGLASFDFMEDASAIQSVERPSAVSQKWFDLQGRPLSGRPQHKGLYIVDGHKVVVR